MYMMYIRCCDELCLSPLTFKVVQSVSKDIDFQKAAVFLGDGEREHGLCIISNTLLSV